MGERATIPALGHHDVLPQVRELVQALLAPQALSIDRDGTYPEEFLRRLGEVGGYAASGTVDDGAALARQIEVMQSVGLGCGATAFLVWAQTTCATYLALSANTALRDRYLPALLAGRQLGGTGMSNPMKSFSGIENIRLSARSDPRGYVINGSLPWVSNLGADHVFVTAALSAEGALMFLVPCNAPGVALHPCPEFVALEGTRTFNVRFDDVLIEHAQVVASPAVLPAYLARIKPRFILMQMGIGLGVIEAAIQIVQQCWTSHAHVNQYLPDGVDNLAAALTDAVQRTQRLAQALAAGQAVFRDIVALRADASELALRSATAAVLHAGAKGYLVRHPAQRRLREALFVAIVTPALKHLRLELARTAAEPT